MTTSLTQITAEEFITAFFNLFSRGFRGSDFLTYLNRPATQRGNDEAPIVDTVIVGPLLGLLGFDTGERTYNQQRKEGRPDFAPTDVVYGTCFMVEDKNTSLDLTFDLADPDSHLSQLRGYVRSAALRLGWLTNGRQLTVWSFDDPDHPRQIIDLDVVAALREWDGNLTSLAPASAGALNDLFDLCRKEAFSTPQRLESEIGIDLEEWQRQALPLGGDTGHDQMLVETLQLLVKELQRDARRVLDGHLTRYAEYVDKANRSRDDRPEAVVDEIRTLRGRALAALDAVRGTLGLSEQERKGIEELLVRLETDPRAFQTPKALLAEILKIINTARLRTTPASARGQAARPLNHLNDLPPLRDALQEHSEKTFAYHQRQASLRQKYKTEIGVYDDYTIWTSLVQETMLGGLDEDGRRDEFALQAAYVIFIRLFLIRVCEDKNIFPYRFVSDGGIRHWQEDIDRYLTFANGNPYTPLLDMAYSNAQNIYAHFFTGRELFNWYKLDRERLVIALHRLNRFNFAGVDSDIVGTIYSTYLTRKEKQKWGQYYTRPIIVRYILDAVGYTSGANIIGPNKRLLDPSCGSGTFLVEAAKRLVDAYRDAKGEVDDPVAVLERVRNGLFGFDLNPFACYLAEVNLLVQVLDLVKLAHDRGERPRLEPFHIYNVDSLAKPTGAYRYALFNTLLAEENDLVDQIKGRAPGTPYSSGFAFIVANPPYGAELSDSYKETLRADWPSVFFGQPDTYIFFFKLGIDLLAANGKLGFITPNTYLVGTNTSALRKELLNAGRVEQVVDLPQGIWADATVDCVLMFLAAEADEEKRRAQEVQINLLGLRDTLDKLTTEEWAETLTQQQSTWIDHERHEIVIRRDALLDRIEEACLVPAGGSTTKVQRLDDVTESNQGLIVYKTAAEGRANLYVKPQREVPPSETQWHPLLDSSAYVGRYELRWGVTHPYIKYGNWLWRAREARFFDSPKIVLVRLRNKSLKRRLVGTYDDSGFYNRDNFNNIIQRDAGYNLKYVLALFNSSLLNYWYARKFDNVNINPDSFRQLPIYPASAEQQASLVALVESLLDKHAQLNWLREQGHVIKQRNGVTTIEVPYDKLLRDVQAANSSYQTLPLFEAKAAQMFSIPERCDQSVGISSNVFTPAGRPNIVVLKHNKLWFEVPDDDVRKFLRGYLSAEQWRGKTWNEIKNQASVPADADALAAFFAEEEKQRKHIETLLEDISVLDSQIDGQVLDLYGIVDTSARQQILGDAPETEDEAGEEGGGDEAADTADAADLAVSQ